MRGGSREPYRRPSVRIPRRLLEISQPYATDRDLAISSYGRAAIILLNFASIQEFSPSNTRVITAQRITIPYPELAIPPESPDRKQLALTMPPIHATLLEQYAAHDHVTIHERAAQAFRLANFIAQNFYPLDPIVFQRDQEPPITVTAALQ